MTSGLARVVLRDLLSIHAGVEIVGEAGGLKAALQLIEQEKPDLLFLDIQMPGGGGFEVVERARGTAACDLCDGL